MSKIQFYENTKYKLKVVYYIEQCCGAGVRTETRGAEIKNYGSGSSFLLFTTDLKKLDRKKSCFMKKFLLVKVKKGHFQLSYKTIRSRGRSWNRNSDLRLHRDGAERNIFGPATLIFRYIFSWTRVALSDNLSAGLGDMCWGSFDFSI
jgi:hypothetical protein